MANRSFKLVKACKWDGLELAQHLSDADRKELEVTHGITDAEKALVDSIELSEEAYAIVNEHCGVVYAVGGYTSLQTCWFLTSKYVESFNKEERKAFAQLLMKGRDIGLKAYPKLSNFIWCGNPAHIEFTQRSGARMGCKITFINDEDYVPFEFHREDFPHLMEV